MQTVLRWLDIAVYLVFLALAAWFVARRQLGASFSIRPQAHELVTTEIYAKIRHPVYIFGGLAWLGVLLILLGWPALAIGLIVAAVEFARARREERTLAHAAFGPQYAASRSKSWF